MKKKSSFIFNLFTCVVLWVIFITIKTVFVTVTLTANQIRVNSPRDIYNGEHETTLVIDFITTDSPLETNKPAVLENINSKANISYDNFEEFYVNKSIIISNITDHRTLILNKTESTYKMANVMIGEAVNILITLWPAVRCDLNSSVILVVVHNAAMYTERRRLIRETYGSVDELSDSRWWWCSC